MKINETSEKVISLSAQSIKKRGEGNTVCGRES